MVVPGAFRVHFWRIATVATALPLVFALSREMWELPYPISETVSVLVDAGVMTDSESSPHSLSDPTMVSFLDPWRRSWYRPMYFLTWYVFWHATHSLSATLLLFRILEVAAIVLLVAGFLWIVRPRSAVEYAAATVALAVFVGTPAFRDNLELPLPMTLFGMVFALGVWILLEREYRPWHGPLLVLFTALAVGYKEQGLVLVPLIVGAWWIGAPGVRASTALTITVLTVAYLTLRFSTAGSWRPFEQDVGLGFDVISTGTAAERYGEFPYRIAVYLYNAAATGANILFSEPTNGVFQFVRGAIDGNLRVSQLVNVLTSSATTFLLTWWGARVWRRNGWRLASAEGRLLAALVIALAASAALGFNYSRDRLGGMAVVFYAIAAYYALCHATARLSTGTTLRLAAAGLALMLLGAGWQVRAVGTADALYARTRSTHREWVANRLREKLRHSDNDTYLRIFTAMETQGVAPMRPRSSTYDRRAEAWFR
jgi:hypothetical protein